MIQRVYLFLFLSIGYCAAEPEKKELRARFETWKIKYEKSYSSAEEESRRFSIFAENLKRLEKMANQTGAIYGEDKYTDIPHAEFIAQRACVGMIPGYGNPVDDFELDPEHMKTLKDVKAFDWRDKGAVSSVKDQGKYGTCWAFGVAGVMEGMSVVAGNKLQNASSQELIDCCPECDGSGSWTSFKWLINNTNGYIDTMESYPYVGKHQKCKNTTAVRSLARIASWLTVDDKETQDKMMAMMIQYGPGAIGVDADCLNGYKGGVISNCPGQGVDHAVLLMGVGTDNGVDYFTVKNSWADDWGEHGFFRVRKGHQEMSMGGIHVGIPKKMNNEFNQNINILKKIVK